MVNIPCPRIDYETDDEDQPVNACTGIVWRPDARGYAEPTPDTGGEITVNVFNDSEGDPGVIGGVHHFVSWEIDGQTCVCELTEKELDALGEKAVEEAKELVYDY